jgi:hypothetical protein
MTECEKCVDMNQCIGISRADREACRLKKANNRLCALLDESREITRRGVEIVRRELVNFPVSPRRDKLMKFVEDGEGYLARISVDKKAKA